MFIKDLTDELFAPHDKVFEGLECSISDDGPEGCKCLTVKGTDGRTLRIPAYHNVVYRTDANGNADTLRTKAACVYASDNGKFFLDRSLGKRIK